MPVRRWLRQFPNGLLAGHTHSAGLDREALPAIILLAEFLGIRYGDKHYAALARRMTTAFLIIFAIGAASGMLVAFNMLLLWPNFMALIGQVAILPFYVEVFAFFLETVFLGIYFYSWDSFRGRYAHLLTGIPVAVGAALSGVLITLVNAFMNTPAGFDIPAYLRNGTVANVQPLLAFFTPSAGVEILHVLSSSYLAGSFIFAAYFAFRLLRAKDGSPSKEYYRKGLALMLAIAFVAAMLSAYSGLQSITTTLALQPEKYAAMEANLHTQAYAPERVGGIPINGTLMYYFDIPNLQSILATGSASGTVPGLDQFPQSTWPPLTIHVMFDLMVFCGFAIAVLMLLVCAMAALRKSPLGNRLVLWLLILAGALSVLLLEDGWVMAEVGRQPWIIYNVMTVSQAANYSGSIIPATIGILAFYALVIPLTLVMLNRVYAKRPLEKELKKNGRGYA